MIIFPTHFLWLSIFRTSGIWFICTFWTILTSSSHNIIIDDSSICSLMLATFEVLPNRCFCERCTGFSFPADPLQMTAFNLWMWPHFTFFYKLFEEEKMGKRGKIGGGVKEWRAATASWGKWCERERVDKCKEVNSTVQSAKNRKEMKRGAMQTITQQRGKMQRIWKMSSAKCKYMHSAKRKVVERIAQPVNPK